MDVTLLTPICREHSTVTTNKKLTIRDSEYFETDVMSEKTVATETEEEEEIDVFVEKNAKSVSQNKSHMEATNAEIVPKVYLTYL